MMNRTAKTYAAIHAGIYAAIYAAICPALALIWTSSAAALPALQQAKWQRGPILLSQSFTPPPGSGAPPSTTAGASRSGAYCELNRSNSTVVTPFMPQERGKAIAQHSRQPSQSLTLQERPSFFWHVNPKVAGETANFLLIERDPAQPQGQQSRLMYEAELDLPSSAGVVRLDLPATVPGLQRDRQYEWFLSFDCDRLSLDSQVHLSGWIKRVAPSGSLAARLQNASLAEQARLLAESGIWQDALMAQIKLQERLAQSHPGQTADPVQAGSKQDRKEQAAIAANWQLFLESAGLGKWAGAPLVPTRITEIPAYPQRLLPQADQGVVLRDRAQSDPS